MKNLFAILLIVLSITSCKNSDTEHDAYGVFEADEIIVSSEGAGRVVSLNISEGQTLKLGEIGVAIDSTTLLLQREQLVASIQALQQKTNDAQPAIDVLYQQLKVQEEQLASLRKDQERFSNLLKAQATTVKKLEDIDTQVEILKEQMLVTKKQIQQQQSTVAIQNRGILSEKNPLEKKVVQLNDQISKCNISNPIEGNVIVKYVEVGELVSIGKPVYKIANLNTMILRAYISGDQLAAIKLQQKVKVLIDNGKDKYKEYEGTLSWISDKAEFTPKTIQTKTERSNLVYASKILVKNDGLIKIGMYGEVKF
jgi:HlyD family secretion protein